MKRLWLGLILVAILIPVANSESAVISGGGGGSAALTSVTVFPSSPITGQVVVVTDDSVVGACDSAAGVAVTLCRWNGSAWLKLGDGTGAGGALTSGDIDTSAELKAILTDETGTAGALVFATSPTIDTPTLNSPTLVTPALGTPASGTLTNTTGFPTANLAGAGTGVLTFLATPSSANFAAAVTGETGSGAVVFDTSPTIVTPTITSPTIATPTITGAIGFEDGVRQTFNPNATVAGLNIGAFTTDPSTLVNGDMWYDSGVGKFRCREGGTSKDCIGAAGGSSAFSALTSSTNTTATMLVGTGASLGITGSGTVQATSVTANAVALTTDTTGNYVSSATANMGLLLTGTEGGSLGLIQTCATNEILKWNGTAWVCSADSTGGSPTFTDVASGTNTTATMTCGAGCSVVPSSTGVVAATAIRPTVVTVNAGNSPYTGLNTDRLILCDTTAAGRTITLPAATVKISYNIKNLGANSCTINRAGADTIDGGTSAVLTVQYESIGLDSDGTATWEIF